jgi:Ca-activated chloride channel family protein
MKLATLLLASATGMAATGALVWTAVNPASGSRAPDPSPAAATAVKREAPADLGPDRSQFQAGKTLMMEGRLGHRVLPAGADSETFLFVDVSADSSRRAKVPAPLNLAIVIDRSGSMKGKRLKNAFSAARSAVQRLRDGDTVSVITYNTGAEVMLAPTQVNASTRDRILAAIVPVKPAGDTCISCGVETGMRMLGRKDGAVSRILLLSDGEATRGVRDLPGFRRIAEDCRNMGASITTIGVDVDYNERIMAAIARDSNGRHFFVENPDGLPAIFDEETRALAETIATGAEITLYLAPGVFAEHVFDRPSVQRGTQMVIPLGAFAGSDRKTLLVRLRVPRGAAGDRPVAAVRLRYDDLAEGVDGTCEGELVARLSDDVSEIAPLDGLVSARVSQSETAEALEQANELFKSGNRDQARGLIERKRAELGLRGKAARESAPSVRAGDVDASFARQQKVLGGASTGFADPAPTVAPADDRRAGESQVRSNQEEAFDLSE